MIKNLTHMVCLILSGALMMCCGQPAEPQIKSLASPANIRERSGSATVSSLTFEWDAVEGATAYNYKYKNAAGSLHISDKTDNTFITLAQLESNAEYLVAVQATDGTVKSEYSQWVSAKTLSGATPPPATDFGFPATEDGTLVRAFPGAEGGGMFVSGGRGGKVYHVTNLNDSGTGSLRWAVGQSGKRTIVFDVAGRIELLSDLKISNGDVTIAGQTAPGAGICISGATVVVNADNIIVRFVRFRLGDTNTGGNLGDGSDAFWGRYHENIILDHCSLSWSIDEVASFYANRNFTMQWCMIAEALRNSIHSKDSHGYGGIWGGRNASFHHNLLAHNDSRNARIDHPGIYIQGSTDYRPTHRGNVDYRNNVIYNWGSNSTYGGEDGSYNIVCNYYKPGPASQQRAYFLDAYWYNSSSKVGSAYPKVYLSGNYHAGSYASALNSDNWNGGVYFHSQGTNPSSTDAHLNAPLSIKADDQTTCYTTTHTATAAFERVLSCGGASLARDAVDSRIVDETRGGTVTYPTGSKGSTGGLIDSQSDVGGWPEYSATAAETAKTTDSDGDGIPDYWEEKYGLDKNSADDGNTATLDAKQRYTNLEVYLHWLVKDIVAAQTAGGAYTAMN